MESVSFSLRRMCSEGLASVGLRNTVRRFYFILFKCFVLINFFFLSCFLLQEYHVFLVAKISGTISVFFCNVFFRSQYCCCKIHSIRPLSLSLSPGTVILFFSAGNNLLLPKVWQQVDVSTIQRMGSSTSPFFLRQAIYTLPLQRKP